MTCDLFCWLSVSDVGALCKLTVNDLWSVCTEMFILIQVVVLQNVPKTFFSSSEASKL
jgi:hypothetical protein